MNWNYDGLWQKAKVYAERAMRERRDGPLFPFWCSLTLEFLARAALAKVHPALLADPRGDESMLYAFGYPAKKPKSVPMDTVLTRCCAIVPNFTDNEKKTALVLVNRRNEELHTGHPAFDDLPTRLWLADFYRISKLILVHLNLSLEDLFGPDESAAAQEMINAADKAVIAEARRLKGMAEAAFNALSEEEREQRRLRGTTEARRYVTAQSNLITCPACGAQALVQGKVVAESEPRLEEDDIVRDFTILPTTLKCFSCRLELSNHGALHALEVGGQFRGEHRDSAIDYYASEIDPADYYEPDYGND